MITNERQYKITKAQAEKFANALETVRKQARGQPELHPLLVQAREDAIVSQLADLHAQLAEYEALKTATPPLAELQSVAGLPKALIKARISQGLSQKDLADRMSLKEQQIQRYEATEYASASLARIRAVVAALGITDSASRR